jgi:hypothetical protein
VDHLLRVALFELSSFMMSWLTKRTGSNRVLAIIRHSTGEKTNGQLTKMRGIGLVMIIPWTSRGVASNRRERGLMPDREQAWDSRAPIKQ